MISTRKQASIATFPDKQIRSSCKVCRVQRRCVCPSCGDIVEARKVRNEGYKIRSDHRPSVKKTTPLIYSLPRKKADGHTDLNIPGATIVSDVI